MADTGAWSSHRMSGECQSSVCVGKCRVLLLGPCLSAQGPVLVCIILSARCHKLLGPGGRDPVAQGPTQPASLSCGGRPSLRSAESRGRCWEGRREAGVPADLHGLPDLRHSLQRWCTPAAAAAVAAAAGPTEGAPPEEEPQEEEPRGEEPWEEAPWEEAPWEEAPTEEASTEKELGVAGAWAAGVAAARPTAGVWARAPAPAGAPRCAGASPVPGARAQSAGSAAALSGAHKAPPRASGPTTNSEGGAGGVPSSPSSFTGRHTRPLSRSSRPRPFPKHLLSSTPEHPLHTRLALQPKICREG